MNLNLENKHYIITGSNRGVGFGIAKVLLQEGAHIMITGRNPEITIKAYEELNAAFPQKALFYCGNLTDSKVLDSILDKVVTEWGHLDGIVVNAGGVMPVADWDISDADWSWYFANNFDIAVKTVTKAIPLLLKTNGSIVFTSSIAGIEEIGAPLPYSASKASLTMYAKGLSRKLAPFDIRVNTIAPGNIIFEGGNWEKKQKVNPEGVKKMLEDKVPLKQFGTPSDIGNMVAFLLSEKAKFITGACMVIDGGQTSMFN